MVWSSVVLPEADAASSKNKFIDLNHTVQDGFERVVLEFSGKPGFRTFTLTGPERLVIDFTPCIYSPVSAIWNVDTRLIKSLRVAQHSTENIRFVLDTAAPFQYRTYFQPSDTPPVTRFVIDLMPIFGGLETLWPVDEKPLIQEEVSEGNAPDPDAVPSFFDDSLIGNVPDFNQDLPVDFKSDHSMAETSASNKRLSISGQVRHEAAYRLEKPHQFTKLKTSLRLDAVKVFSDNCSAQIKGEAYYDPIFDLSDNYDSNVEDDQEKDLELKEAYIDLGYEIVDFRIGKQQIVWGQAVGVFFADIINPKDLREYILPDLDDIRIPIWALDMECFYHDDTFEFVFIPNAEFNELGVAGSEFDFTGRTLNNNEAQMVVYPIEEPDSNLENTEYGVRWSRRYNQLDFSLFYFKGFDRFPVNYRQIVSLTDDTLIEVSPSYEKMNYWGATFSSALNDVVLKGEFVYNQGKFYSLSDDKDFDGVAEKNSMDCLVGMDYTFGKNLDTNIQYMQTVVFNYEDSMVDPHYKSAVSFWAKTSFLNDRLEPEFFLAVNLLESDCLVRPRVTYKPNAGMKYILGLDLFTGVEEGDFGYFNENDRVFLTMIFVF